MVFLCSPSYSKSPQDSNTHLSILADVKNVIFWMVSASSNFQVLQSLYQSFGDRTKRANYNWYYRLFHSLA